MTPISQILKSVEVSDLALQSVDHGFMPYCWQGVLPEM